METPGHCSRPGISTPFSKAEFYQSCASAAWPQAPGYSESPLEEKPYVGCLFSSVAFDYFIVKYSVHIEKCTTSVCPLHQISRSKSHRGQNSADDTLRAVLGPSQETSLLLVPDPIPQMITTRNWLRTSFFLSFIVLISKYVYLSNIAQPSSFCISQE